MDYIASFYPPLAERCSFPALYLPTSFFLTLVPFLSPDRRIGVLVTFPLLLFLCLWAPFYTFGSPSADYYNIGPFLAMLLWYLDFAIFTPANGPKAPVFVGDSSAVGAVVSDDASSMLQKLGWVFRLMIPSHRGIGWNWQVKGVPSDPNARLPKWMYVRKHLQRMTLTYLRSVAMLVILGFSSAMQAEVHPSQAWVPIVLDVMVGWSSAVWVWDRLNCFYSLTAAITIAVGLCEIWEWPPLTGQLRDAWSVLQMWGAVYHQVMRRMVQQPALRIAHLLRLHKGSIASRYTQLYISFGMSCLYHEFQIFNVTRKDAGEFAFFMSQAVAITAEDLVQWAWRKLRGQGNPIVRFEKMIGYLWVFVWFSYSLPTWVKGARDADIIRDVLFETRPLEMGSSLSLKLLASLKA